MVTHAVVAEAATTSVVDPRERVEYWTDLIDSYHGRLDYRFLDRSDFHGRTRLGRTRTYQLVGWESDAVEYHRTARQIRTDPDDDYRLLVPTLGSFSVQQDDQQGVLAAGTGLLVALDRPFRLSMGNGTRGMIMTLPRGEVRHRLGRVAVPAEPLDFSTGLGRVVAGLAENLDSEHTTLTAAQFDTVAQHLVDLLCLLILGEPPTTSTGLAAVETSVRQYIHSHASDPELTVTAIARELGWSVRQIQLALQRAGTTPRRLIAESRLQLAHTRLRHPAYRRQTITEIALSLGFGSLSTFSTAFRQRFGLTPSELREMPQFPGRSLAAGTGFEPTTSGL